MLDAFGSASDDRLAWFPLFARDLQADPAYRRLSPYARGVLVDLLCLQWEHRSLPAEVGEILRLGNWQPVDRRNVARALPALLADHFPLGQDGRRRNLPLERTYVDGITRKVQRKAAGKKGAARRWGDRQLDLGDIIGDID